MESPKAGVVDLLDELESPREPRKKKPRQESAADLDIRW